MDATLERVKVLVADVSALSRDAVRDDGLLVEYGIDSVRAMDLIISLEETFAITVADEDAALLRTVRDVARYVEKKRGA
ncbi:MAG: acyl carrier protein [Acidobacteriota bacterium]